MPVPESSTPRHGVIRTALRTMPWITRICAFWLLVVIVTAITADLIPRLPDPNYQAFVFGLGETLESPSWNHWLGTDNVSRDILARVIYGARVSLIFATFCVASGLVFGGLLGSTVGFVRGRTEGIVMYLVDVVLAFPALVFFLFVVTMLNSHGLAVLCGVVGFLTIAPYTRVARANALAVSNREFVTAARAIGTAKRRILFREILPNVYPTLWSYALVSAAVLIILESTLSFLGIGVQIPTASWGGMINEGRRDIAINIWPMVPPIFALVVTILSFNRVADWLRNTTAVRSAAL